VDPAIAIATLAAAAAWFDGRFDGAHLILALLVFAMTFPGSIVRTGARAGSAALAVDALTGWMPIVAVLALLGWASGTLGAFDARTLAAWAVATPVALFTAHTLLPPILSRVLSADAMQRTAVIAGANELGRRLAEQLRDPMLGVRVAGYFDDRAAGGRPHAASAAETLGSLTALADYARSHRVDIIYIALPMASRACLVME